MDDDLAFTVFDKSECYAVEKRVFSCESVKRQKISSDEVSGGCITERIGNEQNSLIELIAQGVFGDLIYRDQHKNSQEQHYPCKGATDLPLEADTS